MKAALYSLSYRGFDISNDWSSFLVTLSSRDRKMDRIFTI